MVKQIEKNYSTYILVETTMKDNPLFVTHTGWVTKDPEMARHFSTMDEATNTLKDLQEIGVEKYKIAKASYKKSVSIEEL